jgi:hypothetical protein
MWLERILGRATSAGAEANEQVAARRMNVERRFMGVFSPAQPLYPELRFKE